jgi:hypothetical protein
MKFRFIEFSIHSNCKQNVQIISLEYSRNMGLSWQLLKYFILNTYQSYIVHEDLLDEMRYDYVLIRLVFITKCSKIEQVKNQIFIIYIFVFFLKIVVSGSIIHREVIYGKFDQLKNLNTNLFVSFGDGIFNGTYLMFPSKRNLTMNEIITDDLNIPENSFHIQLTLVPLVHNRCLSMTIIFIDKKFCM